MAAADFFTGLFETAVGEDELLTEIRFPKHTGWGAHYEKFVRVSHQWSIVAVAATVKAEGGTIQEARVGLTNMGDRPLRATAVEQALVGGAATEDAVRGGGGVRGRGHQPAAATSTATPTTGAASSPVLTRRAVLAAAGA